MILSNDAKAPGVMVCRIQLSYPHFIHAEKNDPIPSHRKTFWFEKIIGLIPNVLNCWADANIVEIEYELFGINAAHLECIVNRYEWLPENFLESQYWSIRKYT